MGMMITGSFNYSNPYTSGYGAGTMAAGSMAGRAGSTATEAGAKTGGVIRNPGESTNVSPGRKSSPAECETCKNRKYQDGSDEMVSFKSASHISPQASASRVRAHEQEHVSNAYAKAAKNNGKVLSATVSLKTAICPECGQSYTAGGTTSTKIKYTDESNPYTQNQKKRDAAAFIGQNLDIAV